MKNEFENKKPAPTLADVAAKRAENAQVVKALKDKASKARAEWDKLTMGAKYSYFKTTPKEARIMREWDEIEKEIAKLEKIALILRHNYRAIMAAQVLPVFVEILKKYDCKKAGEKTREKIAEEMRTSCGCSLWFERNYNSQKSEVAHICERFDGWRLGEELNINTKSRAAIIDEENTINGKLTADDLRADVGEYIENPAARVEEIAEAERRVEEARKTHNATIDAYNALIVDGYNRKSRVY